ncbi:disease resistance protein [Trifolium medium]|uniref:Disease resistance protein n=1 Tax=Trifolium medium TaxID=97028 RepID=A0A392M092_9FABA|nr:disease resistance protein [Trifolium medium]
MKLLDYGCARLLNVPEKLGNLIHLKYLSFRYTEIGEVPKSIGMLQNLETFDVRGTNVRELPKEISKLRKLRHLVGSKLSLIKLKEGIGEMTSLQTLRNVDLGMDGVVEVIKALGKLEQIRNLGLVNVWREYGSIISSSINQMQHLEKLCVESRYTANDEVIDLHLSSSPTMLRKLSLRGRLQKFPEWILELQNLVVLTLICSHLTNDPMQSLKSLQKLLILHISLRAYDGLGLYFQDGGFQKLQELYVENSDELRNIIIDKGALPSLKKLHLHENRRLENIPTGIQHLEKLEDLYISYMSDEFVQNISTDDWNWVTDHVPLVEIHTIDGNVIRNSRS